MPPCRCCPNKSPGFLSSDKHRTRPPPANPMPGGRRGSGNVHLREQPSEKLLAQFGDIVEEPPANPLAAGLTRIERNDFTAPFGVDDVPIGFELFRIDEILVVIEIGHIDAAKEDKNMAALRVHVMML